MEEKPIYILDSRATWNFDFVSEKLNRSVTACWMRWQSYLLPIIKTYSQNSTLFPFNYFHWRIDVLMYLVDNKLEDFDDNDVCEINDRVCRGQSVTSIKTFLKSVKGWKSRKSQAYQNQPLHELAQLRLHNKSPNSLCVESSTKTERHIERIKKVVQVYDVLSSQYHLK